MDGDSLTPKQAHHEIGKEFTKTGRSPVTIDFLPDEALLEIFVFYEDITHMNRWCTLVHVCRKWRNIVFGSPRRLNLRLWCMPGIPVRETLDVWPLLPIIVSNHRLWDHRDVDSVVTALEHNDRICSIDLRYLPSLQMEEVLVAMQQPFQELTSLMLGLQENNTAPVAPDSFLGGSTPRLEELFLVGIPFPGLPTLLLSATQLVSLDLWDIPDSGYISPEAMVTSLSPLTNLENLRIHFESAQSRPDPKGRRPPPSTRTLISALATLAFQGASEYLEDLVAQIDAPLLGYFHINFFHQPIFDTPQLNNFISRTPKFKTRDEACVEFSDRGVLVTLSSTQAIDVELELTILCKRLNLQIPSLIQVCSSSFPQAFVPAVEQLFILEDIIWVWPDNISRSQWLEALRPFTAVKDLYISCGITPRIAGSLQDLVGERVTEVLPALQTLFLEESLPSGLARETIEQFISARQLAGHPISVSSWEGNEKEEVEG